MLEIKNLTKRYGESTVNAVEDFSIELKTGEIFGFLGPNGAGKSTTIKSLVGIYPFQEGDILIDGVSIKTNPLEAKMKIGYVSDNHAVFERLTGREYVNHIANLYKVDMAEAEERAKQDGILQSNIDAEILNRENAIKALSYTNAAVSGQYVSEVTQTNGKISVTRAELPNYSSYWNRITELEKLTQAQDKTIQDLLLAIEGLTSRIEALEAYHQPEEEPEIPENPEEPIE